MEFHDKYFTKEELEKKREELGVQDCFEFIGARENPYAYMKNADVLVQTSRFEGKSVVLDEGKISGIGTHEKLMLECEIYKNMAELQLGKEEAK